jgi:hypothetical protein
MMVWHSEIVATPDPPSPGVHNPIHDAEGADAAGYAGALVAGVRTYGWAAQTLVEALGADWRHRGWVDITLRRPLFADEKLAIKVTEAGNTYAVSCVVNEPLGAESGEGAKLVMDGDAGLGNAPWLSTLTPPDIQPPEDTESPLPSYELDTVPLQVPMHPLGAWVTADLARKMVAHDLGVSDLHYQGEGVIPIHPYFLAGRMAPLTRHNFTYGSTIHVRSQIQHLREGRSDREIVVGARIVDAYERKGHWYQVLDGVVSDEDGALALIRHHTIFRPRPA